MWRPTNDSPIRYTGSCRQCGEQLCQRGALMACSVCGLPAQDRPRPVLAVSDAHPLVTDDEPTEASQPLATAPPLSTTAIQPAPQAQAQRQPKRGRS